MGACCTNSRDSDVYCEDQEAYLDVVDPQVIVPRFSNPVAFTYAHRHVDNPLQNDLRIYAPDMLEPKHTIYNIYNTYNSQTPTTTTQRDSPQPQPQRISPFKPYLRPPSYNGTYSESSPIPTYISNVSMRSPSASPVPSKTLQNTQSVNYSQIRYSKGKTYVSCRCHALGVQCTPHNCSVLQNLAPYYPEPDDETAPPNTPTRHSNYINKQNNEIFDMEPYPLDLPTTVPIFTSNPPAHHQRVAVKAVPVPIRPSEVYPPITSTGTAITTKRNSQTTKVVSIVVPKRSSSPSTSPLKLPFSPVMPTSPLSPPLSSPRPGVQLAHPPQSPRPTQTRTSDPKIVPQIRKTSFNDSPRSSPPTSPRPEGETPAFFWMNEPGSFWKPAESADANAVDVPLVALDAIRLPDNTTERDL